MSLIRVELPWHLRNLAGLTTHEVEVEVVAPVTQKTVLDALEERYIVLRGTIRDHSTLKRRPFLRFFACGIDLSHQAADEVLPAAVVEGREPLMVVGAIAGG